MTACGTSYHAALIGESLFEQFARIPVEVEYASEFRYRNPPLEKNTVVLGITQSGETADTLAALRESKRKGLRTLALCNVVGSTIAREADGGVYLHAGPEIGVASTKAFTAQVTVLALLALYLGRMRHLSHAAGAAASSTSCWAMPDIMRQTLQCHDDVKAHRRQISPCQQHALPGPAIPLSGGPGRRSQAQGNQLHSRRGLSGRRDETWPDRAGRRETPSVFLAPHGAVYDKVMSNLEEIKARGGPVIAIACENDDHVEAKADDIIHVPRVPDYLQPSSWPSRCNFWRTTLPCCAAATLISRGTWPRA